MMEFSFVSFVCFFCLFVSIKNNLGRVNFPAIWELLLLLFGERVDWTRKELVYIFVLSSVRGSSHKLTTGNPHIKKPTRYV